MTIRWNRRLDSNPKEAGTYLVCRANGHIERLNFGSSKGWDNGREKREAKADHNRRVIAWADDDGPPVEWRADWRKLTGAQLGGDRP